MAAPTTPPSAEVRAVFVALPAFAAVIVIAEAANTALKNTVLIFILNS